MLRNGCICGYGTGTKLATSENVKQETRTISRAELSLRMEGKVE